MLLDVRQQRVGDINLVFHPGDHGFDVGEQIGPQLLVPLQVVVIVRIDIRQDVIHQRFFIVGVDLGRLHLLHTTRGDVDP